MHSRQEAGDALLYALGELWRRMRKDRCAMPGSASGMNEAIQVLREHPGTAVPRTIG